MRALGLRAEARVALGRARALAEELGADRPLCAEVLGDVSRLELGDGHAREALADAERAIAIEEATHTPGVAQPLASRGEALLGLHRPADAMAALDLAAAQHDPREQPRLKLLLVRVRRDESHFRHR